MAKTIVGLFDSINQAQNVVTELTNLGISRDSISLVSRSSDQARMVGADTTDTSSTAEGAGAGAIGGGVLGGTLGLLVGLGALAIPGIGPVIAAGPLAAALSTAAVGAGIGAAAGGLIGALVGAGVPEEDANVYAEGVRRGGTLVTVTAPDNLANSAYSIMQRAGAVDVNDRATSWRSEGWDRFDPNAPSYDTTGDTGDKWDRSSKVGTVGGGVAGAATGAAIGSVGGPVGTVIGGIAGAAAGSGVGAAGDIAGESVEETDMNSSYGTTGRSTMGTGMTGRGWSDYESTFRDDFNTRYANSGYSWDQYSSAYRYGYDAANDTRYRGRNWNDIESDLRTSWDPTYGPWDRFKDAVRRGWERTKDAVS